MSVINLDKKLYGFPVYQDFDLGDNYNLDSIAVFTSKEGYVQYTIYTSMDGRDFEELIRKTSMESCDFSIGDTYVVNKKEARMVRVYIEYHSIQEGPSLERLIIEGTKSETKKRQRPELTIPTFQDSIYNVEITPKDTIEEVYGIIERTLGEKYKSWFTLELAPNPYVGHSYDYYELSNTETGICVKGNTGVSLATGINYYLKQYCMVHISQVGKQVKMPEQVVFLDKKVVRETKTKVRYAYNYCTFSYSMAFFGEKEWREELDWLALNGVNLVLDITAQEEVFRRFLLGIGYCHEEIKKFIAGPAYYAWAYMSNLFGFGGPVHDSWFEERTELTRKNQLIMRKLGIQPVLQGYSGIVPVDIAKYDKEVEVIPQGTWCSFQRPSMLKTTSKSFLEYATKFYEAQKEVYGEVTNYYATDPFHEGGIIGDMSARQIAKEVLQAMLSSNKNSVWLIQSWEGNPSSELLEGIAEVTNGKEHALILDLYAEKLPHYKDGAKENSCYGYKSEFSNTPWVFCMLNNFGGRLGLHGHLDNLLHDVPYVFGHCNSIVGIGITPEASANNPILYDFFFDCIWQENAEQELKELNLEQWLIGYIRRRYGIQSQAAKEAWDILLKTVYLAEFNQRGQGAPESIVNARPDFVIQAASAWGNAIISYPITELEKAVTLLLEDYNKMYDKETYLYDVATILQQILSNKAWICHKELVTAYHSKQMADFEAKANQFLAIIDKMEVVTSTNTYYLLGRWIEQAKALAKNADDCSKRLYEWNAKMLITTWGAYAQSETGKLHDYSNRQWSGLIGDFYKKRWMNWIQDRVKELKGETDNVHRNWFEWEWDWVRQNTDYPIEPKKTDLKMLWKES